MDYFPDSKYEPSTYSVEVLEEKKDSRWRSPLTVPDWPSPDEIDPPKKRSGLEKKLTPDILPEEQE